jgi:hypothetical protein
LAIPAQLSSHTGGCPTERGPSQGLLFNLVRQFCVGHHEGRESHAGRALRDGRPKCTDSDHSGDQERELTMVWSLKLLWWDGQGWHDLWVDRQTLTEMEETDWGSLQQVRFGTHHK